MGHTVQLATIKFTKNCNCISDILFKGVTIDVTKTESSWALIRSVFKQLAIFVFAHTSAVMLLRIFLSKSSPSTQDDPTLIKVLNRIITNTIEHSFIFLGLFVYYVIDGSGKFTRYSATAIAPQLLLNVAGWFIAGRWLFSAGYILGTIIGFPQLRSYGFTLTVFSNVFLLEHILCK
jgi:hypothetical protein